MFLVGIFQWWYGLGWASQLQRARHRIGSTLSFFSVGQLLSTLFSPFRQISAGGVDGSFSVQIRAFFDATISRLIGAVVRTITILAGLIIMSVQIIVEGVLLVMWGVMPLLPVIGGIVFATGWVPSWM